MPSPGAQTILRHMRKEGILELLKRNRDHWSRFHLFESFRRRLQREPKASFNDFLVDHGLPASERYAQEADSCMLLWHASERRHLENILKHGLFHHRGVFFAPPSYGLPICLADGISSEQKRRPDQCIVLMCLFDTRRCVPGRDYFPGTSEYRFTARVSGDVVYAAIADEQIVFTGQTLRTSGSVTAPTFVRHGRTWGVSTQNPCRFPGGATFSTPEQWLALYLAFLFSRNAALTLYEIVNAVYLNMSPLQALSIESISTALADICRIRGHQRGDVLVRPVTAASVAV